MGKRKAESEPAGSQSSAKKAKAPSQKQKSIQPTFKKVSGPVKIQIVAGSYDRVLHGIIATVRPPLLDEEEPKQDSKSKPKKSEDRIQPKHEVEFADTFLFNAHNSAIRCLALSPPSNPAPGQTQKVLLATGSTDERINIYNLSAHPPSTSATEHPDAKLLSSLAPRPILENPKNRELGTLLHHSSNITRLVFPNRSKLLSASEDSTIAVTRVRDWTPLHTFKCPIPKPQGRPYGDTAARGTVPSGVNDFAVHPSNKIMISVSKGERCMRLWNLETGKKSRVLNFEKEALIEIGEGGKWSTGEARRIVWGSSTGGEDEFAVGFDRDVLVYGMDCRIRCRVMPSPAGSWRAPKVQEFKYVTVDEEREETVLVVAAEDGRILFCSTAQDRLEKPADGKNLPVAKLAAQMGGKDVGVVGRIKDFVILPVEDEKTEEKVFFIVTGSSDGKVRFWRVAVKEILEGIEDDKKGKQVGTLLGTYETQNRITCMGAFIFLPRPAGVEESEYEFGSEESEDEESDDE
ncbi:uncharacterized protein CTHT_0071490 [Thermochaetoides thermophila DSM 1495]|uniref:Uncharacterized protein n=1 Tax=Chaetomium thermophilum (strain DSM 1495 / CBS 144.50 / IMI 039719) TaxID=759272 RepID=G0SFN5_CHATD|nr:hypothetical protein CTHT_0071490 [Thermochaetoides thermophila DSM 1495]EGS17800.1 hypothetical protein CTHT_0071490 [Thermochaetoides thermophila DSM 1495]